MTPIIAKIKGEENLEAAFAELFHVVLNLRIYSKEWENLNGGWNVKKKRKYWEEKCDSLIKKLESGEYVPTIGSKKNSTTAKPEIA